MKVEIFLLYYWSRLKLAAICSGSLLHVGLYHVRVNPALNDFKEKGRNEWIVVIICPESSAWITVFRHKHTDHRTFSCGKSSFSWTAAPPCVSGCIDFFCSGFYCKVSKSLYIQTDKALTCHIVWILTDPCHKYKSVLRHYHFIRLWGDPGGLWALLDLPNATLEVTCDVYFSFLDHFTRPFRISWLGTVPAFIGAVVMVRLFNRTKWNPRYALYGG